MSSRFIKSLQIALVAAFALTTTPALAQDWTQYPYSFFIETSTSPIQIKGMADVHVSDWETFGTGSSEGRMALPLGEGNSNNPLMPGIKAGFSANVAPFVDLTLDFSVNFGSMMVLSVTGGADIFLVEVDNFRMGAMARIGYMMASLDAGTAQVLPGKTPPVIINDVGTFRTGDEISAELTGVITQAGLVNEFYISPDLGIRLEAGFQYAYINQLNITSGIGDEKIELPVDNAAVVQPELGSTTQAGIDPKGQSLGLTAGIGLVFRY